MTHRKPAHAAAPIAPTQTPSPAQKLPWFGPGLVIRVPLLLWPEYQRLYGLEVLPSDLPAHERIKQQVVYVRRTAPNDQPQPMPNSIRWCCLTCPEQPQLYQHDMMVHMRDVHDIDVPNAVGTKTLTLQRDEAGESRAAWEYVINGLKFLKFEPDTAQERK